MSDSTRADRPHVLLVPLDERPVNLRDPGLLAALGGAELRTPPAEILGRQRAAGDPDAVAGWLREHAGTADAAVVSLNQLCMGGFVPSRTTAETLPALQRRLEPLRGLREAHPELAVRVFLTVMRTRDADDGSMEPSYWATEGRALYRLSELEHRAAAGQSARDELGSARRVVSADARRDVMARRLRHHALHLASIDALATRDVDLLVLACEDTAPWGWSAEERAWLERWLERLDLDDRALVYPGADEVGSVLVAHSVAATKRQRPRIALLVVDHAGLDRTAPYEDVPISDSLPRHVTAAGAELTDDRRSADLVLALHTPAPGGGDWVIGTPPADHPHAEALAEAVAGQVAEGAGVAVADVAYANGADPALVDALDRTRALGGLRALAGWNTAGNTIGSALATGLLASQPGADDRQRRRMLAIRLLDDWAYQTRIRPRLCERVPPRPGGAVPDYLVGEVEEQVRAELVSAQGELEWLRSACTLDEDAVHLPWGRLFEVSVDVNVTQESER